MERVPYQATGAGAAYAELGRLPAVLLLDNVRSMYNVGALFRAADGATVPWEHSRDPVAVVQALRERAYEVAAVETSLHAVDLYDWKPNFPVCLVFGHEVEGIRPELAALCDTHVRIPMLGVKHSLNVATAGGVALYELLPKYRRLVQGARIR